MLKFEIFDSGIVSSFNPKDSLPVKSAEDFFDKNKSKRARLIYCSKENENIYVEKAK